MKILRTIAKAFGGIMLGAALVVGAFLHPATRVTAQTFLGQLGAYTGWCNITAAASNLPTICRLGFLHSKDFGAIANVSVANFVVSITNGTPNLTVTGGSFTAADQGKLITVAGAGAAGATLFTSITTVSGPTALVLANNAGSGLVASNQTLSWGTNDTTALQAWATACQNASAICYLDAGAYAVNASLSVTTAIMTTSPSGAQAILVPFNGTLIGISINTNAIGGVIADIGWEPFGVQTGGAFIQAVGGGTFWKFNRLYTFGPNTIISMTMAGFSGWAIHQSLFGCSLICLNLDGTTFLNDSGDSVISDSWIEPAAVNATGIRMINTGGLKVANTKIISVSAGSRAATWTGTASCSNCSDLVFSNMSVEVIGSGLVMTKGAATGNYGNISVNGGEWNTGGTIFDLSDTAGTGFFTNIAIAGVAVGPQNATAAANFGAVAGVNFSSNTILGLGTSTQGIIVGTATTSCTIGHNQAFGTITTYLTDNSTTKCSQPLTGKAATATGQLTYTAATWTPTLIGSTSGAFTLTTAVGSYEQIGRQITLRFTIVSSANAAVGNVQIGGLPVTSANVVSDNGGCVLSQINGWTGSGGRPLLAGSIAPNALVVGLVEQGSGLGIVAAPTASFGAATTLIGQCTYHN